MGQKPSLLGGKLSRSKLPLSWVLRDELTTRNPNPEQPIKFQYKTRRKKSTATVSDIGRSFNDPVQKQNQSEQCKGGSNNASDVVKCRIVKTQNAPLRTKSEPSLIPEKTKEKHRHRRRSGRIKNERKLQQFGYEIQDVDAFLSKATIEKPANIPVVLAFPSVLYQTRIGGYQAEISLPLGMVVNAVFKNQNWLYVQTPHAEEGYVSYAACLPLGIIPPDDDTPAPCWEKSTDVFPKPSGNMTDTEKLSSKSECSGGRCRSRQSRTAFSMCGERSVDRLYLRAAASAKNRGTRETLLIVICDYKSEEGNTVSVQKGDVVALLSTHLTGWFWIRTKDGNEGFIPAEIAGHGFL